MSGSGLTLQDEVLQEWRSLGVQTHTQFRSVSPAFAIFACFLRRNKFKQLHQILQGCPQKMSKKKSEERLQTWLKPQPSLKCSPFFPCNPNNPFSRKTVPKQIKSSRLYLLPVSILLSSLSSSYTLLFATDSKKFFLFLLAAFA